MEEESRSACFINQERICGPDCMAYLTAAPEGKAYMGENWAHCMILINLDRTGRHLTILANTNSSLFSLKRNEVADGQRLNQQPPPPVK